MRPAHLLQPADTRLYADPAGEAGGLVPAPAEIAAGSGMPARVRTGEMGHTMR